MPAPIYDAIPDAILDGLDLYLRHGTPPGGFLAAVLSNDLIAACQGADAECGAALTALVHYLWNGVPREAWGDREALGRWRRLGDGYRETAYAASKHAGYYARRLSRRLSDV